MCLPLTEPGAGVRSQGDIPRGVFKQVVNCRFHLCSSVLRSPFINNKHSVLDRRLEFRTLDTFVFIDHSRFARPPVWLAGCLLVCFLAPLFGLAGYRTAKPPTISL